MIRQRHVRLGSYGAGLISIFILSTLDLAGQPLPLTVHQSPWEAMARRVPAFDDQVVTALGVADKELYVAQGRRVFVYFIASGSLQDVTSRIRAESSDEVTSILVDAARSELWIGTNGNTHASVCYDYALRPTCASKAYLDEWLRFADSLTGSPRPQPNSIWTFDRDEARAVVGFFKGNVYAYDVANQRYRLLYRPTSLYNWVTVSLVRGNCALVGTRGDGVIAVDLAKERVARYPDGSSANYVRALATDGREAFLAAKGLYRARRFLQRKMIVASSRRLTRVGPDGRSCHQERPLVNAKR
jgi:hypothetical protein